MPILDTFCASISYFTQYFVEGNSIWCEFHGWREFNSICGNVARFIWVGNQVLRNIFLPCDSKHAVKYLLGLVIFIGSVVWYGLSWTFLSNWRNWLGLIMIWWSSVVYNTSWNTRIYCWPVTDVNPVAANTMSTYFMGLYVFENGATSHDLSVWCKTV